VREDVRPPVRATVRDLSLLTTKPFLRSSRKSAQPVMIYLEPKLISTTYWPYFLTGMVEIRTDELHMKSVSISEFQKHRNNKSQTLLMGPQEILPAFSKLIFRFRNSSVLEASKKSTEWLWVSWKSVQWKPHFTYGRTFHIYCPIWAKSIWDLCKNLCLASVTVMIIEAGKD